MTAREWVPLQPPEPRRGNRSRQGEHDVQRDNQGQFGHQDTAGTIEPLPIRATLCVSHLDFSTIGTRLEPVRCSSTEPACFVYGDLLRVHATRPQTSLHNSQG